MNAVETLRGRGALAAVQDAHGHLVMARERVEELRTSVRSAIRVSDDVSQLVDQARSGPEHDEHLRGRHLDAAAEDLTRLRSRCEISEEIVTALGGDLDKAAAAVTRARDLVTEQQTERLMPRLDAIEDSIDATRPIVDAAVYHLHCASESAGEIAAVQAPSLVTRPQQLEHRLATADRRLERVDEDVRFLDLATVRATTAASRSAVEVAALNGLEEGDAAAVAEISAAAHIRLGRDQQHSPSAGIGAGLDTTNGVPDLGRTGPTR